MRELTWEELELIAGAQSTTGQQQDPQPPITLSPTSARPPAQPPAQPPEPPPPPPPPPISGMPGNPGTPAPPSDPQDHCYTPLPSANRVDTNFLITQEGGVQDSANVPTSKGGVTIGAGVDLSSQTVASLTAAGVPQSIINSVSPYLGLTGSAAQSALSQHGGLTLSPADAQTLTQDVMNQYVQRLTTLYNGQTDVQLFSELPASAQTAIADVAYQYDPLNLPGQTPSFWNDVLTGNWSQTVNELNNFGDAFSGRREAEGDLVNSDVTNHALPLNSSLGQCSK